MRGCQLQGVATALFVIVPFSVQSQADTASGKIFGGRDAITTAAFTAATLAISPLDRHITAGLRAPSLQGNAALHASSSLFRHIGQPGAMAGAVATYAIGRANGSRRASEVGLYSAESIVAATAVNYVVKGITGRARPYVVGDSLPHEYDPGRGFHDRDHASFASGHTVAAFAGAVSVGAEIKELWPHSSAIWTPALITTATLVGVSRIYDDQHWASDVVAGAAIGAIVARIIVHANRAHPVNSINRALLPKSERHPPVVIGWEIRR